MTDRRRLTDALDTDLLPASARELAEAIGFEPAMRLIAAYGGCAFYVPRWPTAELEALIGADAAQALVDNYYAGSDRLNLPRCAAALRAVLHRRIVAAYYAGASAGALAREHGCTERWIYMLVARHRQASTDRQAELF
jgi:hypothetical protein